MGASFLGGAGGASLAALAEAAEGAAALSLRGAALRGAALESADADALFVVVDFGDGMSRMWISRREIPPMRRLGQLGRLGRQPGFLHPARARIPEPWQYLPRPR